MATRIARVDFDARTASLVVKPSSAGLDSGRVREIVAALKTAGMQQVDVHVDAGPEASQADGLRAALGDAGVLVHQGDYAGSVGRVGNRAFQCAVDPDEARAGWTIEACLDSLDRAVVRSALLVALVRLATNMNDMLGGQLRFAVHELVANAVDHADFSGSAPRIELAILATPSTTLLSYRDNAGPFTTTTPPLVDIDVKIARGERRGLGLFMLNRMAQQVRYRRDGDWNETTVLFVRTGNETQNARRSSMEGLELKQTPCKLPNTVVLKPVGSIDSTTVHVLDARLNALASQAGAQIVLDMSEVDFISSAGVGLFLGTVSQLRTTGGDLIFTGMLPAILEVFEIINLSAYFRIVPSLEALEPAPRG